MKKILNAPDSYVDEMIEGILAAYPNHLKAAAVSERGTRGLVVANAPIEGKVGIATGGGSGHIPLFLGYLGTGLADGVAVGDVFSSPSAQEMFDVTRAIDSGKGVLHLYGNYGGDVLNFDMAAEMAEEEGIEVQTVLAADDVASAPKGNEDERRGIAGIFYAYKAAGACADGGAPLEKVREAALDALRNVRTIGVAISPCTVPGAEKPSFSLDEADMEIGMGIHGEAGIRRGRRKSADAATEEMLDLLFADMPVEKGEEVSVLVNSLGATPLEELYIVYRRAAEILGAKGIEIYRPYVGRYATSLEMAGFSISLLRLNAQRKRWMDHPVWTPFVREGAVNIRDGAVEGGP